MVKVVDKGERICNLSLDGTECSIVFQDDYKYFAVQNNSGSEVNISLSRGFNLGDDGVMSIPNGNSVLFPHMKPNVNQFFAKGSGKIQVFASNEPINPFKSAPVATGGGGKSEYAEGIVKEYNDFNNLKWVEITQHNDNSFVMTDKNTIECCFMYSSLGSENKARIFETKDNDGYLRYTLHIDNNGFLAFYLNKENWYESTASGDYHIEAYEIAPNILYNITAVFKNASTDIYINGILFASIPETIAIDTRIKDLCLKASFKVANRHLDGHIFSLRMYNRALSENEILNNWEVDVERYGMGETKI